MAKVKIEYTSEGIDVIAKDRETLENLSKSADEASKELAGLGKSAGSVDKKLTSFNNTVGSVADTLTILSIAINAGRMAFDFFIGSGLQANQMLADFRGETESLGSVAEETTDIWNAFTGAMTKPFYVGLTAGLKQLNHEMGVKAPEAIDAMWETMKSFAKSSVTVIAEVIKAVSDLIAIIQLASTGISTLSTLAGGIGAKISGGVGSGISWLGDALGNDWVMEYGLVLEGIGELDTAYAEKKLEGLAKESLAITENAKARKDAIEAGADFVKTEIDNTVKPDFTKDVKDFSKMRKSMEKIAKKSNAKISKDKKSNDDKALKKALRDYEKYADRFAGSFADAFSRVLHGDIDNLFEDFFNNMLDDAVAPFINSMSSSLSKLISDNLDDLLVSMGIAEAKSIAVAQTTGIANAGPAVVTAGVFGGVPGSLAMIALIAGLGMSALSAGSSSAPTYTMPSYSDVSTGGNESTGTALNYEGSYLSVVDYNKVLEIARHNQSDFNAALGEYNDLMEAAHEIWTNASSSLRKWGGELTDYMDAVDSTRAVGSWDALNEFYDVVATTDEQIEYLSETVEELEKNAGIAGLTIKDMGDYIKWLVAQGDQLSMAQANRVALLGNAQNKLDEAILSKQEDAAQAAAEAADDFARAAEEAEEAAIAAEELIKTLRTGIAQILADWTENSVEAAKLILTATTANTGLTGLTAENFVSEFAKASSGILTAEELDKWSEMSSALLSLRDAVKLETQALLDSQIREQNSILTFEKNVLKLINTAYTGSLNYMTTTEKADYAEAMAKAYLDAGNTQSYLDSLGSQLRYEKAMSVTKEEYMPVFDQYIRDLREAEPEKTTDDVVETLESIKEEIADVRNTIEIASYT